MPLNCRGCDKLVRKGCLKGDYRKDERPKQCPLRPLPKKQVEEKYDIGEYGHFYIDEHSTGWNDCLDEILGEEE